MRQQFLPITELDQALPYKRLRDASWDFKGIPASSGIYAIHPYPAMFHFGIVRRVIREFSQVGDWVLDPFMGSGVAATESLLHQRAFVGYDLNPLAIHIAKVRTTPLPVAAIKLSCEHLYQHYREAAPEFIPTGPNLHYWFDDSTVQQLSRLHTAIRRLAETDPEVERFFWVSFSEAVRICSLSDEQEFKLVRRKTRSPSDVWSIFARVVWKNIAAIAHLSNARALFPMRMHCADFLHAEEDLEPNRFDLVITSPPYGDSRTTVAYGQFSRLSLWWLGMSNVSDLDKRMLGSRRQPIARDLPSPTLYAVLDELAHRDLKRAEEVFGFYADLFAAIQRIAPLVKRGKHVFFLVGNRRVKGIELPTDKICADFFESQGYQHVRTYVRSISNKRMPVENSPTNIPGQRETTMRYEYLVHLQRMR